MYAIGSIHLIRESWQYFQFLGEFPEFFEFREFVARILGILFPNSWNSSPGTSPGRTKPGRRKPGRRKLVKTRYFIFFPSRRAVLAGTSPGRRKRRKEFNKIIKELNSWSPCKIRSILEIYEIYGFLTELHIIFCTMRGSLFALTRVAFCFHSGCVSPLPLGSLFVLNPFAFLPSLGSLAALTRVALLNWGHFFAFTRVAFFIH